MIVGVGLYVATTRHGVELHVDRPLSMEQADVLAAIIERAGQTPNSVFEVEWAEGQQCVRWFWLDGRVPERHETVLTALPLVHK